MAKKKDPPLTGITVSKEEDFSGWYTEIINKAELADIRYNIKGFVCYRPWATITIKKMFYQKIKWETETSWNTHNERQSNPSSAFISIGTSSGIYIR